MKLGLKGDIYPEQLFNRLNYKPDILELYLREEDILGPARVRLEAVIESCQDSGIEVFLHFPMIYDNKDSSVVIGDSEREAYYNFSLEVMATIVKRHNVRCVIHPLYIGETILERRSGKQKLIENISYFVEKSNNLFLWENLTKGFNFSDGSISEEVIKELNLPLCFDISHAFISHNGDNDELIRLLEKYKDNTKYFHVVDSMGETHDSLEVGKGNIDWERVKPYLINKPYVYEINLKDQTYAREQLDSHDYLSNVKI